MVVIRGRHEQACPSCDSSGWCRYGPRGVGASQFAARTGISQPPGRVRTIRRRPAQPSRASADAPSPLLPGPDGSCRRCPPAI